MADRFQHWIMFCKQIQDQPAKVSCGLSQFVENTVHASVFVWLLPGSICPRQLWTGLACFSRRSMMGVGWLFIFLNSGNYWFQTLLSRSDEGSVQWGNCRCLPLHSLQVPSTLIYSTEKYGYYTTPSHPSTVSSFMNHNFLGKRECPGHSRRLWQCPPWTRGTSDAASRSSSSRTRTPRSGLWTAETSCPGSAACLGSQERFKGLQRRLPRRQTTWNWLKGGLQFQWQLPPSIWQLRQAMMPEATLRLLQLQVNLLYISELAD